MIDLSDQQPFASGSNRHCFRHPDDPTLCLKVVRPENIEARYRRQHRLKRLLGKARLDDNQQELRAHRQRALIGLPEQTAWAHLPRFFGQTDTTLGTANVSEFLAAPDDHPAETLEHYLQRCGLDPAIQAAIDRFCAWLRATGILTRNLLPHNLVIAERNGSPNCFWLMAWAHRRFRTRLPACRPGADATSTGASAVCTNAWPGSSVTARSAGKNSSVWDKTDSGTVVT